MYNYNRPFIAWALFAFIITGYSLEAEATGVANIAPPALMATIKGNSGEPKKYIRVEINGPEYKKIATNNDGVIATKLKPGDYTILIRERGHLVRFKITVNINEVTQKTFDLPW